MLKEITRRPHKTKDEVSVKMVRNSLGIHAVYETSRCDLCIPVSNEIITANSREEAFELYHDWEKV